MKWKIFIFNLILTVILITPATSLAAIINYSTTSSSDDGFFISTPEGSYSTNLLGNLWFDSEPYVAPYPNQIEGIDKFYLFDILAFSLVFDIPDLNESLTFAGTGGSTLQIVPDYGDPSGAVNYWTELYLSGLGNFSSLYWSGMVGEWIFSFNGDLPQSVYVSGDGSFYGEGFIECWSAPILGKDNWALLCDNNGDVLLNRTPVPEPSTFLLLGIGLFAAVGFGRKILLSKYYPY